MLGTCMDLTRPDAAPDSGADVQPDAGSVVVVDAVPDRGAPEAGADRPKPCSGCADPGWACLTCFKEPPATNAVVFIQCVGGRPYDCNGQRLYFDSSDETCSSFPDIQLCWTCTSRPGLQCPSPVPYCNTTTGACSAEPAS